MRWYYYKLFAARNSSFQIPDINQKVIWQNSNGHKKLNFWPYPVEWDLQFTIQGDFIIKKPHWIIPSQLVSTVDIVLRIFFYFTWNLSVLTGIATKHFFYYIAESYNHSVQKQFNFLSLFPFSHNSLKEKANTFINVKRISD